MTREHAAHLLLRIGAAFAFLYPPLAAMVDYSSWIGYLPSFALDLPGKLGFPVEALTLLHGFGALEIALALWLLSGRSIRIPAALMTLLLLVIVALNVPSMDVVFRDLSIAAMTLALALWPAPRADGSPAA